MTEYKVGRIQLHTGRNLSVDESEALSDSSQCSKLIGLIHYLENAARLDIIFSVGYLSRLVHDTSEKLCLAVKKALKYLKNTVGPGVLFKTQRECAVFAFSDVD